MLTQKENSTKCGSELLKNINVLNVISLMSRAWRETEVFTIMALVKCLINVVLMKDTVESEDIGESDEDVIPLVNWLVLKKNMTKKKKRIVAKDCK